MREDMKDQLLGCFYTAVIIILIILFALWFTKHKLGWWGWV